MNMSVYDVFILMFDALDTLYDEMPNQELGNYLSGLNPFLFKGVGSAVPAEYEEFKEEFFKVFGETMPSAEQTFYFCKAYLKMKAPKQVNIAFDKVEKDRWIYSVETWDEE